MIRIEWRCNHGVSLTSGGDGILQLSQDGLPTVPVNLPVALTKLALRFDEGVSDEELAAAEGSDTMILARLLHLKRQFQSHGLLVADLYWQQRHLATLRPRSTDFNLEVPLAKTHDTPAVTWRLSRFAFLRRENGQLVLEATDAPCDVEVRDPDLGRWILNTAQSGTAEADPAGRQVLDLLASCGFFENPDDREDTARQTWEFHDRLFHRRTRNHQDFRPPDMTWPFRAPLSIEEKWAACPQAIRPAHTGATMELPVPEADPAGRTLADVMESRRSRSAMGDPPVSIAEVAELLYRVARLTECKSAPGENGSVSMVRRPYPSAGSLHELEFYVAVGRCGGLEPGTYHYRNDAHALTHLPGDAAERAAADMVTDCALSWNNAEVPPQCVIIVASRLQRLAWKYSAIAYHLSLLNSGVVLQSLYLVATDLGLNCAASGIGRPALLEQATGISSWEEASIVEFGFGSRPAE